MAERTIKTKLLVRTDTTANWESENPILQANEFGFDSTVQAFKKGDGTTTWNNLEYVTDTRLLKKLEKATDSDKLDGQDGSYYLNYNNLSNKPSILDEKVKQSSTSTESWRKVLLGKQTGSSNASAVTEQTDQTYVTPNIEVQPSTGTLAVKKLMITDTNMANHIEFKRNNWNYIVASGGTSSAFGFVAGGKSASGSNTTLAIYGDKFIPGQRDNQVDMGDSSYHFKNFYIKGKFYNGNYNYTLPSKTGTFALTSDIPTVNNGTLTIQKNGTNVTTFTANQSSNATANITVPTKVSELTNDSGFTNNTGTVTSVKVGSTSYNPSSGVVTLPAYPEVPNVSNKVNGASSSTDNAIVRFDGTGGKTIQNSGVTIDDSNNLTTKGMIKIQNGSASGSFVLGADVNASTLTANQRKLGRMGVPSYDSTTKTIAGISFDSQANVNLADFGGHPNNTSSIAPDVIRFTVANEHNNSVSGTRKLALQIANQDGLVDSSGGGTSVKGAKFFIPVQTTSGIENTGKVSSSQGFVHTGVTEANRSTSLLLANGNTINTTSFQNAGNYTTKVKVGNTSYEPSSGVISLPAYPTVPTKLSQLTNDSNFITNTVNNLNNYYTKTETNNLINNISTFNALIVSDLPSSNISTTTIYLVSKSDSETDDYYDEYMYINNAWEMIGNTKIDLSNYYKKSETFNKTEINSLIETLGNELDGKANTNQISNLNERVYLVIGNTSGTAGTWTGTNERITSYFDGLVVNYKIGVAGASTTTLNINGLGAKTVYLRGTTKVTTHYEVGTMVLLSYNASKGAFYSADYDANSYAYARQYKVSTDAEYPMLFSYVTTIPSSYDTNYTGKTGGITVNPSTGTITATTFKGNATSSTKAVQDGNGNVISETYATKEELEAIANGGSEQQWTPKEGYNLLQETEYIYVSPETSKDMDVTIGEGINTTEGYWFSIYWGSSTNKKYLRMITNEGLNIEMQLELVEEENDIYSVISGGLTGASITMTNNGYVYFVEKTNDDYYTKPEIDNKILLINNSISTKVNKVSGKGLSTNDYTTTEKNKLAGISAGAEKNVQADWNETDTTSDAYIKNKPTIPSGGTIDDSNYAKLNANNNFTGNNTFTGQLTFQDLLIPSGSGMQVSGVFADKNGSIGSSGQVLTSTGSGSIEWRTPSSTGGSSSGGTSYPLISFSGESIYDSPLAGDITLEDINKIIQAGGFISKIDNEDYGMKKPFIITYLTDTDISLEMSIDYPEDSYSEFFTCWIGRETLEYNVTFSTAPMMSQNFAENVVLKDNYNIFTGENEFQDVVSLEGALNTRNGVGSYGQVLTSTGNGVMWTTPSSSGGSGGGSTPRTIITASQNPTAYSVAFYENQDEGGYNLDITLNLPNSYFKLDLSEIEQIEDIDLNRVKWLNISSNYNDAKAFVYNSNGSDVQSDYPYFNFRCSNGLLFVENGSVSSGDIFIDGACNYIGEDNYISLYCDNNIFQYTFYAYYDEIGNCHISYSFNGYEV